MSQDLLNCPTDCTSSVPEVDFNECSPSLLDGEITYILLANGDQPFANINDPAEHSARVDNSGIDASDVRKLLVIGSFTSDFGAERPIPGGKISYGKNTYTLNAKIYDNNETNYDFIRSTACNSQVLAWLVTSNGVILGGNTGISLVLKGKGDIPESRDEFWTLELQGKYTATRMPLRDDYVMATGDANLQ